MNKKIIKKLTAAAMAFSMIGGAVSVPTGDKPLFGSIITANAAGSYASLNESTGVLTIGGEINKNMLEPYRHQANIVIADESAVLPKSCNNLFRWFNAESIDLSKADASIVTDMNDMFDSCKNLKSVDLGSLNTSNVTTMGEMFYNCQKLESVNFTGIKTENVTRMDNMFTGCKSLESLDVSDFDTSNVNTMFNMFWGCSGLKTLDISTFDTRNVTNMTGMFYSCSSLESLDLSGFTVSSDTYTSSMFYNCSALEPSICRVIGRTVTLDGYIGANIYLQPCEKLAKVVMSGPNGDKELTDFSVVIQEDGTYKFSYPINAAQADELITLKAYDKDGNRLIVCDHKDNLLDHSQASCTVYGYIDEIKKDDVYSEPKLAKLVDGLENYCKAADNYFDGTEKTIEGIDSVKAEDVADYAPTYGNDVKLSLVLNSASAMRLYLNADNVMLGDSVLAPKTGKYGTYREISNIPAQKLSSAYDVIADGTEYKFVPLSYVYRVLNNANASKQLTEIAKATYVYATAAEAYAAK